MSKVASIYDLENKKMSSLIWQYALPAIVGTSVNALYNIIDRFFIGNAPHLGDDAMTAIGIALPVMTLITAVGMLIGAGSASRISIFMGQGDKNSAEKILGNAMLLQFSITLPVSILLIVFLKPILTLLGATGSTFHYAYEFLIFLLPGSVLSTTMFGFNNMMRASGYPQRAMYTMLLTVVINIILAPIFIYLLDWGMMGAALATVIAMFVGMCFVLHHFLNRTSNLTLKKENLQFDKDIVKAIISIGMSPFLIQLVASTVVFVIIHQLQAYGGDTGVAAYTIINSLIMLIIMVITGLTQGMQPIVGYNFGAGKTKRVQEALVYTIKVGIAIGTVGLIIGVFVPDVVVLPFNPKENLAIASSHALKITTLMMPLIGFQIVVTSFFQSLGMVKKSIFLSLSRQLLFFIPALFILPLFWDMDGVWMAFPVSDFFATVTTTTLFVLQMRTFKRMHESGTPISEQIEE